MRFMWPVLVSLGLLGGCTSVHPLQQAMPGVTPHSAEEGKSLLDKQAIYEVLSRYCRGVDRLDEELVRGVYHDDAIDDHGLYKGPASDFFPWVSDWLRANTSSTLHSISNVLIELSGAVAHSESHFTVRANLITDAEKYTRETAGRYLDRFEKRNGEWKIAHRRVIVDWTRTDALSSEQQFPLRGQRSRKDPVYERF